MAKKRKKQLKTKASSIDLSTSKFKYLECYMCGREVKVDFDTKSVKCGICNAMVGGPVTTNTPKSTGRPRGWQFMLEFVDSDGTVYIRGVEQPSLKGKRPITDVEAIKKEQEEKRKENKKNKAEREAKREAKLVQQYKKKKEFLKKEKEKKEREKAKSEGSANKGNSKRVGKNKQKKSTKKKQTRSKSKKKVITTSKTKLAMFTNVKSDKKKDDLTDSDIKKFCRLYDKNNYRLTEEILVQFDISRYQGIKILKEQGYYD